MAEWTEELPVESAAGIEVGEKIVLDPEVELRVDSVEETGIGKADLQVWLRPNVLSLRAQLRGKKVRKLRPPRRTPSDL